jgi:N-methylhydantoinase A
MVPDTFFIGVDVGGTFTDCVVLEAGKPLRSYKASSTPRDPSTGLFDALELAAADLGLPAQTLLGASARLVHGTTVATNAVVERRGAPVGLLATRGHGQVLLMMRGMGRTAGRSVHEMLDIPASDKPEPLVPLHLTEEINERIDCDGDVVVALREEEVREAVRRLVAAGAQALAICFLWSFRNPDHERRAVSAARAVAPDLHITASADLIPRWGEYERAAATALNAYVGPESSRYLERVSTGLAERSLARPPLIVLSSGGVVPASEAARVPLFTLGSGPVAGLVGAGVLGELIGCRNIIATDMGGTSFDVGLIYEGEPVKTPINVVGQYHYALPSIDIQSIGAGGGTIAWIDPVTHGLRLGPRSAGAQPGPACYGRGGTEATVTDADLVLGYLDGAHFLGGRMPLDRARSVAAVEKIGDALGLGVLETAAGIARVCEFHMADLIRKTTVEKGFDPRQFVLFAYGGAGPVHCGVFARELGIQRVIIPLGGASAVWSALGAAGSDLLHVVETTDVMVAPLDPARLHDTFKSMDRQVSELLLSEGVPESAVEIRRWAALRYRSQIHEVEVPVPPRPLTTTDAAEIVERFEQRYARLYGEGAGFREAGIELVSLRVEGIGRTPKPSLPRLREGGEAPAAEAHAGNRAVYWSEMGRVEETPVLLGNRLQAGNVIEGPSIVEMVSTTLVVRPSQRVTVDAWGNLLLDV